MEVVGIPPLLHLHSSTLGIAGKLLRGHGSRLASLLRMGVAGDFAAPHMDQRGQSHEPSMISVCGLGVLMTASGASPGPHVHALPYVARSALPRSVCAVEAEGARPPPRRPPPRRRRPRPPRRRRPRHHHPRRRPHRRRRPRRRRPRHRRPRRHRPSLQALAPRCPLRSPRLRQRRPAHPLRQASGPAHGAEASTELGPSQPDLDFLSADATHLSGFWGDVYTHNISCAGFFRN